MVQASAFESPRTEERTSAMSTAVTESSFDKEVLQSDKPVIVDFWAEWCGPCHAVAPVLDKIAEEREDEVGLVKINVDEGQELMIRDGVQSIPTIVLFKDGEPAAAVIGAQPKGAIERGLGLSENGAQASACSFSGCGTGPTARWVGSSTRLSTRIPCTKTIEPPSHPPTASRQKPTRVRTNGPVVTLPSFHPAWPKIAASAKKTVAVTIT